jgi:H+/gluconate symporter-like permease
VIDTSKIITYLIFFDLGKFYPYPLKILWYRPVKISFASLCALFETAVFVFYAFLPSLAYNNPKYLLSSIRDKKNNN